MDAPFPFDESKLAFFARGNSGDVAQWINDALKEKPIEAGDTFTKAEQSEFFKKFEGYLTRLGYESDKATELLKEIHSKKKSSRSLFSFYEKCSQAVFSQMGKNFNELDFSFFDEGSYLLKIGALKQIIPLYRIISSYMKEIDPERAEVAAKAWDSIFNPPQDKVRNYLSRLALLGADKDIELNRLFNTTARKTVFRDLAIERDSLIANIQNFSLRNRDKLPSFDVEFFELSEEEMKKNLQLISDIFTQHTGMKGMIVEHYYRPKESFGSCSYDEARIFVNSSRFKDFREYHFLKTELQYLYEEKILEKTGKNHRSQELERITRIQEISTDLAVYEQYAKCTKKDLVDGIVRTTWHELIHAWLHALRVGDILPLAGETEKIQKDLILLHKTAVPNVDFAERHFKLEKKEGFEIYINSWEEAWVNEAAIKLSLAFKAPKRVEIPSPNEQSLDIKSTCLPLPGATSNKPMKAAADLSLVSTRQDVVRGLVR
jgi:hypothetical protein